MNFQIESVAGCHLKCNECAVPHIKRAAPYIFMQPDVFETILRKYVVPYKRANGGDCPPTIIPHKDGEPLLNKNYRLFMEMVRDICPDMKVAIYTDGLLLPTFAKQGRDFIDFLGTLPMVFDVLVSFHFNNHDGTTNDYGPLTDYLKAKIRTRPHNVRFILASHLVAPMTRERLDEWKASWDKENLGIPVHANCSINPWTGRVDDPNCVTFNACPYSDFGHWFFGATGNVIPCCLDLEEDVILGNVMTDDPAEVYERCKAFYERHQKRDVPHTLCNNCYNLPVDPQLIQVGVRA